MPALKAYQNADIDILGFRSAMPQFVINGRYQVREPLGEGGMGVVYRAYDQVTKRAVAIKMMRDMADPAAVDLFAKEWTVLANISHPNIVDILDSGEFQDGGRQKPYFVMPLLPGKTLDQLIRENGKPLSIEQTVEIIVQTCRGLQAAHDQGLIHRDLKPSNIFVMDDNTAKIIDFGVVHLTGTNSITGIKGTWQYMAPEQFDLKPATVATDLFGLGVVTYEALTGRKPFARKLEQETAEAVRSYIPPPVSQLNPDAPELLSRVVHKAMAKQPWHRFSSAREYSDTLRKALRNEPIDRFDRSRIQPRIDRVQKAFAEQDFQFAQEILNELEAEGNLDPEMTALRVQIDGAVRRRTIRQLLESARIRVEQEEYPLALQKVQEVLELDPDNADALRMRTEIESQRSEHQIENWLRIVREHLDRGAFNEARQGIGEARKLNPNDTRANQLLAELGRLEQETNKARAQKEQLFGSAREAFQNGDLSSALSSLERLLDLARKTPDRNAPERDAIYQNLYKQVRSEHDAARLAYEDARRALADKQFARAQSLCDDYLAKYPGQALFQALKIEVSEKERQEQSSFIAELNRRVDAEPDLDRKINLLKEAEAKYPNERQFQQTSKLLRERRDLVQAIVSKGRHHEEQRQFAEALAQWDIVRSIYPQFPGLDFEVEQLQRRRADQTQDEAKARWVEQIDRALESGNFAKARELATGGLAEFPSDAELAGLERLARGGMERCEEAQKHLAEGQQALKEGRGDDGIAALRRAAELDNRNPAVTSALGNAVAEKAHVLVDDDPAAAESLANEALEVDSANASARRVLIAIQDNKRKQAINESLADARELQAHGDLTGALAKVDQALATFPKDVRLCQLQATLKSAIADLDHRNGRFENLNEMRQLAESAERAQDPASLSSIYDRSIVISGKYRDDPDFGPLAASIANRAAPVTPVNPPAPPPRRDVAPPGSARPEAPSTFFSPTQYGDSATALLSLPLDQMQRPPATPAPDPAALVTPQREEQPDSFFSVAEPAVRDRPVAPVEHDPPVRVKAPNKRAAAAKLPPRPPQGNAPGLTPMQWGTMAVICVLVLAAWIVTQMKHAPKAPPAQTQSRPVQQEYTVPINVNVPDAMLRVDGQVRGDNPMKLVAGPHTFEISAPGYRSDSQVVTVDTAADPIELKLDPEPIKVRLQTDYAAGTVFVDGQGVGDLQSGQFTDDIPADNAQHTVVIKDKNRELVSFSFNATPAQLTQLSPPVKNPDMLLISSFGAHARVLSGTDSMQAQLTDQPLQPIPADGLELSNISNGSQLTATNGKTQKPISLESGNAPVIMLVTTTQSNPALIVSVSVPDAQLVVNDKPENWRWRNGRFAGRLDAGAYSVKVVKPGYRSSPPQTVELTAGMTKTLNFELTPIASVGSLIIESGTPGAEVSAGAAILGVVDPSGHLKAANVPLGSTDIRFRKDNFEPKQKTLFFAADAPVHVSGEDAQLRPYGSLSFQVSPADAEIKYRRDDEGQFRSARNHEQPSVKAGRYVVAASAPSRPVHQETVSVEPGKPTVIAFELSAKPEEKKVVSTPAPHALFAVPEEWQDDAGWWHHKGQDIGYLHDNRGRFTITLQKRSKVLGFGGKIEWVVGSRGKDWVTYQLGSNGVLTRRSSVNGKEENGRASEKLAGDVFSFVLNIEPTRIRLTDARGSVIDEYANPDADFTQGKFGFKGDVRLSVSH